MSDLTFTGSYRPLTAEDLRTFEQWLEHPLPPRYRAFLLRTNGGHPHRHRAKHCYLQAFYAIAQVSAHGQKYPPSQRSQGMSLEDQVKSMLDDLPPGVIPIAFSGNGDRVCLSLQDDRIFLWQHDAPYVDSPPALEDSYPSQPMWMPCWTNSKAMPRRSQRRKSPGLVGGGTSNCSMPTLPKDMT